MSSRAFPFALCLLVVLLSWLLRLWPSVSLMRRCIVLGLFKLSCSGILALRVTLLLFRRRAVLCLFSFGILHRLRFWLDITVWFDRWSRWRSFLASFVRLLIFYRLQRLLVFGIFYCWKFVGEKIPEGWFSGLPTSVIFNIANVIVFSSSSTWSFASSASTSQPASSST